VKSLMALRQVVSDSFALQTFEARVTDDWQAAYERFLALNLLS
jgi:hypothetical protein